MKHQQQTQHKPSPPVPLHFHSCVLRKKDIDHLGKIEAGIWLFRIGMTIPKTVPARRAKLHQYFQDKPENHAVTMHPEPPTNQPQAPSIGAKPMLQTIMRLSDNEAFV